jgi:putative PEP-CTERM system TPR-repeat lipoprotein
MKLLKCAAATLIAVWLSACSGPSADEHFAKGNSYSESSQYKEAIVEYKLALQADPRRGDVLMKLGAADLQVGDVRAALGDFVRAADVLPENAEAQVKAGSMLLVAKKYEDAQTRADKALQIDPKNVDALILKGNSMAGLKNIDGAVAEYQEALALNPAADAASTNLGAIQFIRGEKETAEATFTKAVESAPKSINVRLALANFYWAARRPKEAEDSLKAALALDPKSFGVNRAIGVFYMVNGRAAEAEPYFKTIAAAAGTTESTIGLADYYIAVKRVDEARTVLRELAKRTDAFAAATTRLAAVEAQQNSRAQAQVLVDSVIAKQPAYLPARLLNMRLQLAANKPDETIKLAEGIIKDEPNSAAAAEANILIGTIESSRDRVEQATKAFSDALRIDPRSVMAALSLCRLSLAQLQLDKAETYANQALALQPSNPAVRAMLVRIDLARGNTSRANSTLAELQKQYPNSPTVLNLVAAQHGVAGRIDVARTTYAKAAAAAPNDMEALEGLVGTSFASGRKQDAIQAVDEAMKRSTPSAALYILAGRAYMGAGNPARAEELLKKAIDLEPAKLQAYGLLGQLYVTQKRLGDARDQYTELTKKNPRSVPASTMLAMIMEAERDLPAAEAQYQKTMGMDAEAAVAANNLAWLYVSSNRNLDQALQLAQTAAKQLGELPQVNDTLGWIYYRKGMFQPAVRHLEKSIQKDPADPTVHYHLGMAYLQLGEIDKAKKSLAKSLSLSQNFEGAAEAKKALADLGK